MHCCCRKHVMTVSACSQMLMCIDIITLTETCLEHDVYNISDTNTHTQKKKHVYISEANRQKQRHLFFFFLTISKCKQIKIF